jgi:hypothetical protein
MLGLHSRLLLSEIELQCGFALKAYGDAASALARRDARDFWYSIQALLGAAAHLQRFLVANAELRTALQVPEGSPLLLPELNSADDIHTSLLSWLSRHKGGPLRSSNFGPAGVSDAQSAGFARYIDVKNSRLILFGSAYDLAALLGAIADLGRHATAELTSLKKIV